LTRYALTVAPTEEPITLDQAKAHARVQHIYLDSQIPVFIKAGRVWLESETSRAIMEQTWTATLDKWPSIEPGERTRRVLLNPRNPEAVVSVTVDGVTIDPSLYMLDGSELVVSGDVAQSEASLGNGIVITYTAKASDAQLEVFRLALKLLVAFWIENPEAARNDGAWPAISTFGVDALITPLRWLEV